MERLESKARNDVDILYSFYSRVDSLILVQETNGLVGAYGLAATHVQGTKLEYLVDIGFFKHGGFLMNQFKSTTGRTLHNYGLVV